MNTLWGPPPKLTISEWADQNRILVSESSAEPGRWRTSRAPYQREPMDCITDPAVECVVLMWSSQTGKSEILLNTFGFFTDLDPAPVLAIQPTLNMAEAFSKDRLQPAIDSCPALAEKIGPSRQKDGGNTLLHKKFAGGHITLAGANSPSSLASRPVRILLPDEVDRFPASAGAEGDPVDLAEKRTATFYNRKLILTSTPTITDISRIGRAFREGDQRYYNVPCPHCGEMQVLKFANLKWDDDDTGTARFVCVGCGEDIDESHKPAMLAAGAWVATASFTGTRSFHIWEAYSPWRKWAEIVASFLRAKKTPETLQVWTNTCLGETWEDRATSIEIRDAGSRVEVYDAEVPTGVLCLTCGVDTHEGRLEASVVGWGLHEEPYLIDHVVLPGNTSRSTVWKNLDELLFEREFEWAYGGHLGIECTCIDSGGHRTSEVYKYVEPRQVRRVYAVKGVSGEGLPIIRHFQKTRAADSKIPVKLHVYGPDAAKSFIYSRLGLAEDESGRMHFPDLDQFDDAYFDQLTAEKCVIEYKAGHPRRKWKLKVSGARNEALDCCGMALAAVRKLRPNWRALAKRADARLAGDSGPGTDDRPAPSRGSRRRRKTAWAQDWRK